MMNSQIVDTTEPISPPQKDIDPKECSTSYELEYVLDTFKKWLYLGEVGEEDTEVVEVALACMLDRRVKGDPVWLLIVAPPGGCKTEIVRSLYGSGEYTYKLDSLTTKTLISGALEEDKETGEDIPVEGAIRDLDGKILLIKDFTLILTKRADERKEIFGQLRNAYDGYMDASYGNRRGQVNLKSSFGLIAGVTPVIDQHATLTACLGERYLKIRNDVDSSRMVEKAQENVGKEDEIRTDLSDAVEGFLKEIEVFEVSIPPDIGKAIRELALTIATLRTPVWDRRVGNSSELQVEPMTEYATRIVKQLTKLGKMIAIIRQHKEMDANDLATVIRVGFDTLLPLRIAVAIYLYYHPSSTYTNIYKGLNKHHELIKRNLNELCKINKCVLVEAEGKYKLHPTIAGHLDVLAQLVGGRVSYLSDSYNTQNTPHTVILCKQGTQ